MARASLSVIDLVLAHREPGANLKSTWRKQPCLRTRIASARSTTSFASTFSAAEHVITPGIAALGVEAVERLVKTIAVFNDFCTANDPYEEHDFGCFKFDDVDVMFKIDYFDKNLEFHSSDAADPSVTERVITILRADEY